MTADQAQALISGTSVGSSGTSVSGGGTGFVATNPTPGSAIAFAVNATFSATAGAFFAMKNNASADTGTEIWLNYIKLLTIIVPASAVNWNFAYYVDGVGSNRYSSGGTTIIPANPNGNSATGSQASLYAGALTTAAAGSSARLVSRGTFRGVIPTIYDEYVIDFGGDTGGTLASAAASGRVVVNAPQVIIGPQQWGLLHMWGTSNASTAAQYEFEHTWVEVKP